MSEVEVAKRVLVSYLKNANSSISIAEGLEIKAGNNELLLEHIKALINIFNKAKKELERRQSEVVKDE